MKNVRKINSKEDLTNPNKMKFIKVLSVAKGSILGLEAVEEKTYKYSLICESTFTVVLQLKLNKLKEIETQLNEFLIPLYDSFKSYVDKNLDKLMEHKEKTKILFYEDIMQRTINRERMEINDHSYVTRKANEIISNLTNRKKTNYKNDFGQYEIIKRSESEKVFHKRKKSGSNHQLRNSVRYSNLRSRLFELGKKTLITESDKNESKYKQTTKSITNLLKLKQIKEGDDAFVLLPKVEFQKLENEKINPQAEKRKNQVIKVSELNTQILIDNVDGSNSSRTTNTMWIKLNKKGKILYDSGCFTIPLISKKYK
jgi:hypothetical protein